MSKKKLYLGAAVFTLLATLVTFVLAEGFIRWVASQKLIYNIEMVKYATRLKMPDPEGVVSHVHRPNRSAHLMGVDIALNALGNRGPDRSFSPAVVDIKKILILGSSVTMGWGVPFEKIFSTVLEKRLNQEKPFGPAKSIQIENSGIGNYNTFFQSRLFNKQYPIVRPDLVILHYFISDVEPRGKGRNNPLFKYSFLAAYLHNTFSSFLFALGAQKSLFQFYSDLYADESQDWKDTQSYINEMKERTARDRVPFLIAVIPDIHNLGIGTPYQQLYAKIEARFEKMGIPTLNSFELFQKRFGGKEDSLWIQDDDPHPNEKGHQLMADSLYDFLVKMKPFEHAF